MFAIAIALRFLWVHNNFNVPMMLFTPSIMRQASFAQVWFTLVFMMLFTPSVMHLASRVNMTQDLTFSRV